MTATQREIELLRSHLSGTPRGKRSLDGDLTRRVTQQEIDERHQLQPRMGSRLFLPDLTLVDQHMDTKRWPRSASPAGSRHRQVGFRMYHELPPRRDLYYAETALNMDIGRELWRKDFPGVQNHVGSQEMVADIHQLQPKIGSRIFLPDPPPVDRRMNATRL